MKVVRTQEKLENVLNDWRAAGKTVGFVPTMGALHDGHLSLVKLAQENSDQVVVSIFVNPTQFAPDEDYSSYPRHEDEDLEKLEELGADLVYLPPLKDLYPDGATSDRKAGAAAAGLESDFRPGFFDGVVSVVGRLFNQVRPNLAVFGQKDYQQLMVVQEAFPELSILGAEIVRDEHGLALSSRNAYLSTDEIEIARKLNGILLETANLLRATPDQKDIILHNAKPGLELAGFDDVDYVEERWGRVLAAVRLDKTRLIDNVSL